MARLQAGGDENVVGIAALAKAIHLVERSGFPAIIAEERGADRARASPAGDDPRHPALWGDRSRRASFRASWRRARFGLRHQPYNLTAQRLAECGGIGLRTGCFCAHILVKQLMGIAPWRESLANLGLAVVPRFTASVLPGVIRASLGLGNDEGDIMRLVETFRAVAAEPVSRLHRFLGSSHNATPSLPARHPGRDRSLCRVAAAGRIRLLPPYRGEPTCMRSQMSEIRRRIAPRTVSF